MTTVVNSDSGSGAAMIFLGLIIAAVIGFGVWFLMGQGTTSSVTNTTIQAPAAPALPAAPTAPSGQ